MRSNYWSSDVCSSDLYTRQHPEISQDLRAPPAPDFEGDFRVLTGIFGDHALQEGDGIVVREADAQHAGDLAAVEIGSRPIVKAQDFAGIAAQHLAFAGQQTRAPGLLHEGWPDQLFQAPHLKRDRRLGRSEEHTSDLQSLMSN